MDVATIMSVAQTLFSALECSQLNKICSILGYKSQLDSLRDTVITIKAVLKDADATQELSNEAQLYIDRLKDAVYDADDLLDEFVTLAQRKHKKVIDGKGKVSQKVSSFFSSIKDLPFAYSMSQEVKNIRKKLDAIVDNHKKYGFELDSQPIRRRREETCSYVCENDIIGRDADKKQIVAMLLDPLAGEQRDVSFLTIVGIGGLGKTTLAQLVYNDQKVIDNFPTRIWLCDGDEDTKNLNVGKILAKIHESVTGIKHDGSSLEPLQREVRKHLVEKKFLLIVDDVWNENRNDWLKLKSFLEGSPKGSYVVLTTRSSTVAEIVGGGFSHNLKGLSDVDSWHLFERVAFGEDEGTGNQQDLIAIGHMIVKKCANVPLAIRVVGGLLYGQGKDKWISFKENGLASINPEKNGIFPILKCSYLNLESPLRSCFKYCALFPKDNRLLKKELIHLWMAQGFIVPFDEGQSIENAAQEYFSILLRRCFFQNVVKDKEGELISCKIHDLMHDVAINVARKEVCGADCTTNALNNQTRHLSLREITGIERLFNKNKLRTILLPRLDGNIEESIVDKMLNNCMRLRALSLAKVNRLPDSMGKLLHLRLLDLSDSDLKRLPKPFTKLHNLETLKLQGCSELVELLDDIGKLYKLSCLEVIKCKLLKHVSGVGRLHHLKSLDLVALDSLECVEENRQSKETTGGEVCLFFPSLKYLTLKELPRLKGWWRGEGDVDDDDERRRESSSSHNSPLTCFPHLSQFEIWNCPELKSIPALSSVERVVLRGIHERLSHAGWQDEKEKAIFSEQGRGGGFTCKMITERAKCLRTVLPMKSWQHLTELMIRDDDKVEGLEEAEEVWQSCSSLSSLKIKYCKALVSLPESIGHLTSLSSLYIYKCRALVSLPESIGHLTSLSSLHIVFCRALVSLPESIGHLTSLSSLHIEYCYALVSVPESIGHLTSLSSLHIEVCNALDSLPESIDHLTSLSSLYIYMCRALVSLPESIGHLTSLSSLDICKCRALVSLPESIGHLTSLSSLYIYKCRALVSLPESIGHLTSLSSLYICKCHALVSLPESIGHLTSLCSLDIEHCHALVSLPESIGHLTSLCSLNIEYCHALVSLPESIGHLTSLRSLNIQYCHALVSLPESIGHLTSLRSLNIGYCHALGSLPESIGHLTSLRYLNIQYCHALVSLPESIGHLTSLTYLKLWTDSKELLNRCSKSSPGKDWPNIKHIPNLYINQGPRLFEVSAHLQK